MVIGNRSDNENCSIGLIAGPDSAATSSSPPSASPPDGAPRGTSLSGAAASDKRELCELCGGRGAFRRSHADHLPYPRRHAEQKKYDRECGFGLQRPVEAPAYRAADEDRRDELAARAQAHRHPRGEVVGGFGRVRTRRRGGFRPLRLQLPESASSRARSAGSSSGGSFSLGIRPLSWRGARRCVGSLVEEISRRVNRLAAPWPPGFASLMRAFRACPALDCRRLGGLPWIEISQSLEGQNSLVVGKNAGNFAELAPFCENPSRKHLRIQAFADEFPTRSSREFFRQRRELFEGAGNSREISRDIGPRVPDYEITVTLYSTAI